MVKENLVSVIIPAYNAEKYVKKAIDSILDQTYQNLEIWLLDDASTDNTRNILLSYNDKRIRHYFADENTKKIGVVNDVLKKVNGKYIAFQDADDWSDHQRISHQIETIESDKSIGIVFTGTDIRESGSTITKVLSNPTTDSEIKNIIFNYKKFKADSSLACATMLVKKSIIDEIGGYNDYFVGKAGSDIFWVYNILKSTSSFCINKPLYHILRTENSFTEQLHSVKNIKSAYIWGVISKLIEYDQKGIDLLNKKNKLMLKEIELLECEKSFIKKIEKKNELILNIKNSYSYRIGNILINPILRLKKALSRV